MPESYRFPIFIVASLAVFVGLLYFVLRGRASRPSWASVVAVSAIVVVAGMVYGKYMMLAGFSPVVYYGVPALVTVLLPPLVYRMNGREAGTYVVLAYASAPFIHASFSFLLGWHNYMPFMHVPYWHDVF